MHQDIQIQERERRRKKDEINWGKGWEGGLSQKPAEHKLGKRYTQTDNLKISWRTDGIK
jgi:hypothetical protein